MADLRIADAPEIALEDITGNEKVPTGGYGNSAVTINNLGQFTKTALALATESYVSNAVGQKESKITLTGINLTPVSTYSDIPETNNVILNSIHQNLLNRMEWIKNNSFGVTDHQDLTGRNSTNSHPSTSISHSGSSTVYNEIENLKSSVSTINTETIPDLSNTIVGKQDVIVNDVNLTATSALTAVPSTNNAALNSSLQALMNRDEFRSIHNNLSGRDVSGAHPASSISYRDTNVSTAIDTSVINVSSFSNLPTSNIPDGKTAYVNDLGFYKYNQSTSSWVRDKGREYISILSFGTSGDFTTLMSSALEYTSNNSVSTIVVPDGVYFANTGITYTLNKDVHIIFCSNADISCNTALTLFDINMQGFSLNISGNDCYIHANWANSSIDSYVFKLSGSTLKRNLTIRDINVDYKQGLRFTYGINGLGINYSFIESCLIQASKPIYLASQNTTDITTHAMGVNISNCNLHATNEAVTIKHQGTLAAEGIRLEGGEYLCDVGVKIIDNSSSGYYPPLLGIHNIHMNARQFIDLNGISRVNISGCDFQARVKSGNTSIGVMEFSGVQSCVISGNNFSHAVESGSAITDALPIFHFKNHTNGKVSAFFNISSNNYWLASSATKLISFESDSVYTGKMVIGNFPRNEFSSKLVDKAYISKISISEDFDYLTVDINEQLAQSTDATFSSGVLTISKKPLTGSFFRIPASIVPNNSTVTQIICDSMKGRSVDILFEASGLTFTHGANFLMPNGSSMTASGSRCAMRLYFVNQNVSYVEATTGLGMFHVKSAVPASTSEGGIHGQKIFNGGFVYEYISGTGWVRYAASTF